MLAFTVQFTGFHERPVPPQVVQFVSESGVPVAKTGSEPKLLEVAAAEVAYSQNGVSCDSTLHNSLQPSPGKIFPSSHCSVTFSPLIGCKIPSPQNVRLESKHEPEQD